MGALLQAAEGIQLVGIGGLYNKNTMKIRLLIAFFLFGVGLARMVDWIIFSTNRKYSDLDWETFKIKYVERLPDFLQPLYKSPVVITTICILVFTVAGVLFLKEKRRSFFVIAIFSFVLAFWQLFSLM